MASLSIVIRERLLAVVVPEPLAVAVRDVEEFGLAKRIGVGCWPVLIRARRVPVSGRRRAGRDVAPEAGMAQDGLDGGAVGAGIEGGDELHFAAAFGADERVGIINALDERGPAEFFPVRGGWWRHQRNSLADGRGTGSFFLPEAAGFVGVPAVVADQVFTGLGNVLGEIGNEIQRCEMLKIALDGMRRFSVLIFIGKRVAFGVLGAVENMAIGADVDEAFQAEGAAAHVLDQAFDGGGVGAMDADAAVDAEAAVFPGAHDMDDAPGDAAPFDEKCEDAFPPEQVEGAGRELGQGQEGGVRRRVPILG